MIEWIYRNHKVVGKRDIAQALSLCLFLCLLISCTDSDKPEEVDTPLFRAVLPEQTGIQFSNDLKEDERQNFLTYPYYYNGGGVAIGDVNGDQLPDLYFTGNIVGDRLYLNKGDLTFEDVTRKAGILQQNLWTTGVSFADVNNDGLLDIYVCRSGMRGFRNNLLYINQGKGKFSEQAKAYGLNDNGYSVQAYFFDYDIDGDLDMYLVNHSSKFFADQEALFSLKNKPEPDEADKLYRNEGPSQGSATPRFIDLSEEAGIHHFGFGLSATIADLNGDHLPDIYVANDFFEPDVLYVNQGNGTFEDQLAQYTGHTSFSSMGSDAADFNNDGWADLMVCDMQAADNYRKKAHMASMDVKRFERMIKEGYHYQYMQNTLQLNSGKGRFQEIAELAGVSETDWSWGPLFFDMNNDGWKDLFVSNGIRRDIQYKDILTEVSQKVVNSQPQAMDLIDNFPVEKLTNYTFQNEQAYAFSDQTQNWGIDFEGFSTGAAYADLDLDGDLDLVLNNLDDPASVYENTTIQRQHSHYLQVKLEGTTDNTHGIGAEITIQTDSLRQLVHLQSSRGFQSSVEPIAHIGLGDQDKIQSVEVRWPNGTYTQMKAIDADQRITIRQENTVSESFYPVHSSPFLTEVSTQESHHLHREIPYDDYANEILLPHKYSQLGPTLAVADVNGDGRDDLYVGGAAGFEGTLFLQSTSGELVPSSYKGWSQDRAFEDIGAAFFDADNDGDSDLYVVSGSNEWEAGSEMYQDRLYINDGAGNFSRRPDVLPHINSSGSCVKPADFDQDGDMDLFVGGRIVPGQYPLPARSYLLQNQNGVFTDITAEMSEALVSPGLVTDAEWTDMDNDKDLDLILVGEWMPITVFENQAGRLSLASVPDFAATSGWWYSIASADMDQDGDMDYVAGNVGLNYKYQATEKEPFQVYAADFDKSGSLDIVLGYFNDGQLFPLRGRQCSSEQMPFLKEKFPNYTGFAKATLEEVYGPDQLAEAQHYEAYTFESVYIENQGEGQFHIHQLPREAQVSAVNDFLVQDVNQDGIMDILLAGNMYHSEAETARNDAGIGLVLTANEKGDFTVMPATESGFFVPGDVKALGQIQRPDQANLIVVGNNAGSLQIFEAK